MSVSREDALYGRWVHSHEEDTDSQMVFRPANHPLPPSRGRTSLELRPDGTYVERSPGPVDAEQFTGMWSLEGDRLVLTSHGHRPDHAWKVTIVDNDRLVVRR